MDFGPTDEDSLGYLYGQACWYVPHGAQLYQVHMLHNLVHRKVFVRVDGKQVLELYVGDKTGKFKITKLDCSMTVERAGNVFSYSIQIAGRTLGVYKKGFQKKFEMWKVKVGEIDWVVVLDKENMEVWGNGEEIEVERRFVDNGTVTHFQLGATACRLEAKGGTTSGMEYTFYMNNTVIPSAIDAQDDEVRVHDAERFYKSGFSMI